MRFVYRVAFVKKRIHINYMFYIQFLKCIWGANSLVVSTSDS